VEKGLDFLREESKLGKRYMEPPYKRFFKVGNGSMKDPCSFLGVLAVILFVLVSLGSFSLPKSLQDPEDFSLASLSRIFVNEDKTEIFLNPLTKFQPESPELLFVTQNSLKSVTPAIAFSPQVLGALVEGYEIEDVKNTIVEYIVEPGDSLWSIADKFGISLETVLWANNLNENSYLQPEQKLVILPISGVLHHVQDGDTISGIAQKYKGKAEEIIAFNGFSGEGDIYIGDIVIIPQGTFPIASVQYAPKQVPLASSYFICPISEPCRITQGLHWYNAIDFSHGKCGEPIYAAAAGEVLKVALTNSTSRWAFSGAGNHITILHPNGVVTMYGHIATSFVNPGNYVSQGQVIALMGGYPGTPGAGLSTGCHLHFGVSGAANPFAR